MNTVLIILTYNDGDRSSELAKKVCGYKAFDHIILVNNQSTDNTLELLEEAKKANPQKITVISAPENGGYAKGNNFGARYAIEHFDPDYIFIANPDTFFTDKASLAMVNAMQKRPDYGIIAPVVNQGFNAWDLPGFWGVIESLFLITFNLHKKAIRQQLISSGHSLAKVGVVEGSYFLISREAFEKIHGMDERTFIYGEEIMLSYRLMLDDYKVGILPKERYDHLHSATMKKLNNNSKAKAFHHFYDSFKIYNKFYLHTNPLQDLIFEIAYKLAYYERVIYDHIPHK